MGEVEAGLEVAVGEAEAEDLSVGFVELELVFGSGASLGVGVVVGIWPSDGGADGWMVRIGGEVFGVDVGVEVGEEESGEIENGEEEEREGEGEEGLEYDVFVGAECSCGG